MGKRIYLTVDTECHDIQKLNEYIIGKTKKGLYGLEKILQLGKELDIPINIFLDIPECHTYGDDHIYSLVKTVRKYNQPIFLHVHPDYVADAKRKHLWEYTKDEQKEILKRSILDYKRFCGEQDKIVFRAGAWGVNKETYEALSELRSEMGIAEIIDLSYVYRSRWRCHLSFDEIGIANKSRIFNDIVVFPNTTYIGVDYFNKKYAFELCVPNKSFHEFKEVIDQNTISNITYTMHSWDFIKRWFFIPNHIAGDELQIRVFKKCVRYAQKKGYEFGDLREFYWIDDNDQCINLCESVEGKIKCIWYNYLRFADIGRSFKKYAPLYFMPAIIIALLTILLICVLR